MKTITILSIAIASILTVSNINTGYSKNPTKTYKNVLENKADNSKTISFYEGENDKYLQPTKQYRIKYTTNGKPIEKIQYKWDKANRMWVTTDKYDYIYNAGGKLENLMHAEWDQKAKAWGENSEYAIYLLDIDKELLTVNDYK